MGMTIVGDLRTWYDEGLPNLWQYLTKKYFNFKINTTESAFSLPYVSVRELH
jgi:hypothetical protein